MGIMFKYLLQNIRDNKFRTFLILFSLALSAALFFSAVAVTDTVGEMYLEQARTEFGSSEIHIRSDSDSPSNFFRSYRTEKLKERLEYIVGTIEYRGTYYQNPNKNISVDVKGYDFHGLQEMNPVTLLEESELLPFRGRKVIIGEDMAEGTSGC